MLINCPPPRVQSNRQTKLALSSVTSPLWLLSFAADAHRPWPNPAGWYFVHMVHIPFGGKHSPRTDISLLTSLAG